MKRECETCIKRKTTYCPTSMECMATDDMPYYQNRIMLLEENKQLKDNWNMLKEHLINRYNNGPESISYRQVFIEIRESMQVLEIQQKFELERGNSNE